MRIIAIHSAKRRSSRTKLGHAGAATAMVVLAVGLAALGSATSAVAQDAAKVDYPTGYRDWTHVLSIVIEPNITALRILRRDTSHLRQPIRPGRLPNGIVC